MHRRAALLSLGLLVASCKRRDETLLVFAAASTTEAVVELSARYAERQHQSVSFSFGGSGDLARQIEAGAPADVFLSADVDKVDRLEELGLVARRHDLLRNRLVVVTASSRSMTTVADLRRARRIAIGDPAAVPAGAYARKWLEREGVWDELSPKMIPTLDVRAALAAVESGAADAAIVYRSDMRAARSTKIAFDPPDQPSIVYPIALLSRARPGAAELVALATSTAGRAIFSKHGFTPA
jgi:molybdate transport system substrate-binding protein